MALTRLGPFEIIAPLGQGGMGTVFRARQEPFGRIVALKVLRSANLGDSDSERRFAREVELAAALSHPHLVKVLDGGTIDDMSFIAMELVEGDTLAHVVEHCKVLPWPHAAALVSRLAAGLAYLHDQNILHRDIKPANALLSFDGWVKLMDFGLAKWKEATVMTADGAVVGTLQYLPPEALHGEAASVAGDLWPLGCMLYRMVSGQAHIEASSQSGWLKELDEAHIVPVHELAPQLPVEMADLIMGLLSRDPKARPATAAIVEERLEDLLAEHEATTWDQVLTPDQTEILLGRPAPAEAKATKSGARKAHVVAAPPAPSDESAVALTTQLPVRRGPSSGAALGSRPDSGARALDSGGDAGGASRETSGPGNAVGRPATATPAGIRAQGRTPRDGVKPPPGLRTSGALVPPPGLTGASGPVMQRLDVSSARPGPARRRATVVALAAVLVVVPAFFVFKAMRSRGIAIAVTSPDPSSVTSSPEATEAPASATPAPVIPTVAERGKGVLTGRGISLERHLPRLKAGGKGAARAIEEMRPLTQLTLGKPCGWIQWIELEQWFADPRRAASPPRSPCAQAGPMELFTEKMFLNVLLSARIARADAAVTSLALEHVADYPEDGRTWLAMGRMLELDHRPEASRLAYGVALARLEGLSLAHKGEFMWSALARAMLVVPGWELERDYGKFLDTGKELRRGLRGLGAALGVEGRDRYEAFLRAGLKRPGQQEIYAWVFAEFLEEERLQPARARQVVIDQLARNKKFPELAFDYLVNNLCARGLVDVADSTVGASPARAWYVPFLEFLRGGRPGADSMLKNDKFRERLTRWEVYYQLETGGWERAAVEASALKSYSDAAHDRAEQLTFDLAGRPGPPKWVLATARDLLLKDGNPDHWVNACGTLATPEGRPQMERFLDALPAGSARRARYRALWLSRWGQHAEALTELAAQRDARQDEFEPEGRPLPVDMAEVVCRPLFEALAAEPVKDEVLERARAGDPWLPPLAKPLFQALAAGDRAAARKAAWALFNVVPQSGFALAAAAWLEAGTGSSAQWPLARARLMAAARARGHGLWVMEEIRRVDRIAVKRGAAPVVVASPSPVASPAPSPSSSVSR